MDAVEIERKFLPVELPDLGKYTKKRIEQGYLCTDPVVRIRRSDDEYYMTYKGKGLLVKEEYNLPLNEVAYTHMKPKCDGNIIEKDRYLIPLDKDDLVVELDVFDGVMKGLVMAEVEFTSEEQAREFRPPEWLGEDVTGDRRYYNSNMISADPETIRELTQRKI